MRSMMFHAMEARSNSPCIRFKRLRKSFGNIRDRAPSLEPLSRETRHSQGIEEFRSHARPKTTRNGNMIEVSEGDARSFETIANRRRGESRGIFNAVESLFLGGRDELAVTYQGRRGIRVIRIDAQNIQEKFRSRLQLAAASAAEPSERSALES